MGLAPGPASETRGAGVPEQQRAGFAAIVVDAAFFDAGDAGHGLLAIVVATTLFDARHAGLRLLAIVVRAVAALPRLPLGGQAGKRPFAAIEQGPGVRGAGAADRQEASGNGRGEEDVDGFHCEAIHDKKSSIVRGRGVCPILVLGIFGRAGLIVQCAFAAWACQASRNYVICCAVG